MNSNSKIPIRQIIIFILIIFIIPIFVVADSPIYKDEFLCYDTSVNSDWRVIFPQVSLTGNNRLIQVNLYDTLPSPWEKSFLNGVNIFDRNGVLIHPFQLTSPFIIDDSEMVNTALTIPRTNENGYTLITISAQNPEAVYNHEKYLTVLDSTGAQIISPKCMNCDDPLLYNHDNWEPYGAINNNSKVGMLWESSFDETNLAYDDSIFVRIYDFETDSLGPMINVLTLPLPEIDEPGYIGHYRVYTRPRMAIADDGAFVVVFVALGDHFRHALYVVYNSDYTPRSDVLFADCTTNLWSDTANSTGFEVNYAEVAMESDGDFYIAWSLYQWTPYADVRNHVWVRGFYADGSPKYDPVRVNDSDSLWFLLGDDLRPNVSCDDLGNVLVSWHDARDFPGNYFSKPRNVYVQKIDPDGNLVGFNNRVNNHSGAARTLWHSLSLNNSGQALISWDHPYDSLDRVVAELIPLADIGTFVPGDITYDRVCDISDLVKLVDYMFVTNEMKNWPRDLSNFDGSTDGITDISDLVLIVEYMFLEGTTPSVPDPGIRPNPGKFDLGG